MFHNETMEEEQMVKLLLIADDFTGALDTGIQFAEYGAATKMLTSSVIEEGLLQNDQIEVLVIDAETRHLSKEDAYRRVFYLVRKAVEAGIPYIYKKTDSALRGNIGCELRAVMEASGEHFLPFIPALPAMGRVTENGIHYVEGVPIHESAFGMDPFEPVRTPYVRELFAGEDIPVCLFRKAENYRTDFTRATIGIFDAATEEDICRIAEHLKQKCQLKVMAGCAGFASVLPSYLEIEKHEMTFPKLEQPLLVACGSVNPITGKQIEYGQSLGYIRVVMTPRQQLEENYLLTKEGEEWLECFNGYFEQSRVVMIDTGISDPRAVEEYRMQHNIGLEEARIRIADRIGSILRELLQQNSKRTLMIIGGDTLMSFVNQTKCMEIEPVCEVEPGTVLSSMKIDNKSIWVITKSGGFGNQELLRMVAEKVEA